jgi:dihydroorotase
MSTRPAEIAGLDAQGRLEVGSAANLVVFDPEGSADTGQTRSRSSNSPYLGLELRGAVVHTVYRGQFTFRSGSLVAMAGVVG